LATPKPRLPGDPLHRAMLLPRFGTQLTDQTNRLLVGAFEHYEQSAPPHIRHDPILVSKVRSLPRIQGGSENLANRRIIPGG
jgi:hypothetical protein